MLEGAFIALAGLATSANAARIFTASANNNNGQIVGQIVTGSVNKILTETSMAASIRTNYHAELDRMLDERYKSEATLNSTVSVDGAFKIVQQAHKANATTLALIEDGLRASGALQSPRLRAKSLVEEKYTPSASLTKANTVLGQMITEAGMEYDQLHLECSQFFQKQCTLMETCRQDISSANSLAASWRSKVLGAQTEIEICEQRLPRMKEDLATSMGECDKRLYHLRRDLKIMMNDITVMESVINMTQCADNANAFVQIEDPQLMECEHQCNNATFAALGHADLHAQLSALESRHVKTLVQESLMALVRQDQAPAAAPNASAAPAAAAPAAAAPATYDNDPNVDGDENAVKKEDFLKTKSLPQAALPSDPCQGITYRSINERAGCTLRKSPECYNLQNKFLTIQGETIDKRDELLEEIGKLQGSCKDTKASLESEIETFTGKQAEEHTKLAEATSGENEAAEEGQTKTEQHEELKTVMLNMRGSCSAKFRSLEAELCALKKIRGELNKMKGAEHPLFQDCQVADKWEEQDCSADCGGGVQELRRAVISPPSGGGAACPPVKQMQRCNEQPCPINCVMSHWSGFSACSADCGGGVRMRTRMVKVQARYQGTPCGDSTSTVPCNMESCDADCVLSHWSSFSSCSKACDTGTRFRRRTVKKAAVGRGKCPGILSHDRLQHLKCNTKPCARDPTRPIICSSKVDVVLLLDGSGSTGSSGWEATKTFAKTFLQAFDSPFTNAQISVIQFSGPSSYPVMRRCAGGGTGLDLEKDCKVKMVQHFSTDLKLAETNINGLAWPRGTTLTSAALELALSEFTLARPDSLKVVLVITDGIPLSPRSTGMAAARVRKTARLMFGAVKLDRRGLRYMMEWGSKPTNENVIKIETFDKLQSLATVDTIIADMCQNLSTPIANTTPIVPIPSSP